MQQSKGVDGAVRFLPENIRQQISSISSFQKSEIEEIRFRLGQPIAAVTQSGMRYIDKGKLIPFVWRPNLPVINRDEIDSIFYACCNDSVYSCEEQIRQGYITLPGGHRAGICGTAVLQSGQITAIREITSVNLRIAREIKGAAKELLPLFQKTLPSFLLAGAPGTGKTTLLRDLARSLPDTPAGKDKKIAVIDERREISGISQGQTFYDLGPNCDILDGYPKCEGILMALRALSPQVIFCDELGGMEDAKAIEMGANAGVQFVATIHAGSKEELFRRPQIGVLLDIGIFSHIALLCPSGPRGIIQEWVSL